MTREEAIKWVTFDLESWEHQCLSYHPTKEALNMAIEALKEEPRKTAKWLPYGYGDGTWHKCSNCGKPTRYLHSYNGFDGKKHLIETQIQNYCRYCGAKMDKGKEE